MCLCERLCEGESVCVRVFERESVCVRECAYLCV